MTTVRERLHGALDHALQFNENLGVEPVALLWPDEERQWESALDSLADTRPLIRLDAYAPDAGAGPAYWLRCVVAGTVPPEGDGIPIIYLPGFSRGDLSGVTETNQELAPLASLQHRSLWFTHPNGKDWTIRGWFGNVDRGLGLSVGADEGTGTALISCVGQLLDHPVAALDGRHIDADYLNGLLNPDPVQLLLRWLNDPAGTQQSLDGAAWDAFVQQCRNDFGGFDPMLHGMLEGAGRLGCAEGPWARVWRRFRESPAAYEDIPDRLRQSQPAELYPPNPGAWPGIAADEEARLRNDLTALANATATEARTAVLKLEDDHRTRRGNVWAELGWTPLALALEHLADLASRTSQSPPTGSVAAIESWYSTDGWPVDRAVLAAIAEVDRKADIDAVAAVVTAVYRPWLESAAQALQQAIGPEVNAGTYVPAAVGSLAAGEVVVFIDGLRLDVAHLLATRLEGGGAEVSVDTALAALPTVTQTAKPALIPIDQRRLAGGTGLDARRAPDGPPAGVQVLRSLMAEDEIQTLMGDETGDPAGRGWTETGEIDKRGHSDGFKLAHEVDDQVQRIARRIHDLLQAGWSKVTVVTDHGWLLLPGGLPKNGNLPVAATDTKKGRCARLKDGAQVEVPTVPWHWDKDVRIALAPGISCFEANQTYEHGGVSPQECFVPRLTVSAVSDAVVTSAKITSLKWQGLMLRVEFAELPDGAKVDLRRNAGDPSSSIAERAQLTGGSGKQLLLVEDDDLDGELVHLVVVDSGGTVLVQRDTVVGRNT